MSTRECAIYPRGVDSARVIQVIETEALRGSGKDETDPIRIVRQYWDFDGTLLAENDPHNGDPLMSGLTG